LTTFLKCLFFSQNSTFLKFWKPIWLSIPRGLWPYNFFRDILILRGQNNENITREKIAKIRIAIWGLRSARIKKLKKTDPHFFSKKMGVCFLQLFDLSTPKASNRDPNLCKYFTRKHSFKNSFKQCKISYDLIKFCRIWQLKVSTGSRDNFQCFCTLSMWVTIKSINKSPFHFSLMSTSCSYAAF